MAIVLPHNHQSHMIIAFFNRRECQRINWSNMLMTVCHSHFLIDFRIYADNFYALINSFIFLIDIIYTIANQTLRSIKNKQLVIEQHGNTQQNQFGECCWWTVCQPLREWTWENEMGHNASVFCTQSTGRLYVENRFTVLRDSINIKNIICCVVNARMNAIILLKLNWVSRLNSIGQWKPIVTAYIGIPLVVHIVHKHIANAHKNAYECFLSLFAPRSPHSPATYYRLCIQHKIYYINLINRFLMYYAV